jgi:hypothetical protein
VFQIWNGLRKRESIIEVSEAEAAGCSISSPNLRQLSILIAVRLARILDLRGAGFIPKEFSKVYACLGIIKLAFLFYYQDFY